MNTVTTVNGKRRKVKRKGSFKDNLQLLSMALPTILLLAVFNYAPMFGLVLAFKDYKVPSGIFGSPWAGLKNFEFFLKSQDAWRITRNTLGLNFLFIIAGIICGVIFALIMFEVKKAHQVKIYQTISILPSFLSWVAVGYIVYSLLDPTKGILNQIIKAFGGEGISWYSEPQYWPVILLITKIWQSVGLGSIIYYAALMGVDQELYEAARIDGANRWQQTIHVTIPSIMMTIIMMFIMRIGQVMSVGYEKIILLYNPGIYETADVISTYVYRKGLLEANWSYSAAVGLFNSVINLFLVVTANRITRKVTDMGLW